MEKIKWKNKALFLVGVFLIIYTYPQYQIAEKEIKYLDKIEERYRIFRGDPKDLDSAQSYNGTKIKTFHKNESKQSEYSAWGDRVVNTADIHITINGETEEILKDYDVTIDFPESMETYRGNVEYLRFKDLNTKKEEFIVILQMTKENPRVTKEGNIIGTVNPEEVRYKVISIGSNGEISTRSFTRSSANPLDIQFIKYISGSIPGYYSNLPFQQTFIWNFLFFLGAIIILISIGYGSIRGIFNKEKIYSIIMKNLK